MADGAKSPLTQILSNAGQVAGETVGKPLEQGGQEVVHDVVEAIAPRSPEEIQAAVERAAKTQSDAAELRRRLDIIAQNDAALREQREQEARVKAQTDAAGIQRRKREEGMRVNQFGTISAGQIKKPLTPGRQASIRSSGEVKPAKQGFG